MLKKSYEDYIPTIRDRINKKNPVHGHIITDREIRVVLRYFHRNILKSMKRGGHIFMDPYLWILNKLHDRPK